MLPGVSSYNEDEAWHSRPSLKKIHAAWLLVTERCLYLHQKLSAAFIERFHNEIAKKGHVAILIPLLFCSLIVTALFTGIDYAAHSSDRNLKQISSPWDLVLSSSATDPAWRWGAAVKSATEALRRAKPGDVEWQAMRSRLKEEVHRMRYELARLEGYLAGDTFATRNEDGLGSFLTDEITIPFYMYDDMEFLRFREECEYDNEGKLGMGGHKGEFAFIEQLHDHPWRRENPADALLFVVPVLMGAALEGSCQSVERGKTLLHEAAQKLKQSEWFNRYSGNDHIIAATHWRVMWYFRETEATEPDLAVWRQLIWGRHLASFEDSFCSMTLPYTTLEVLKDSPKGKNGTIEAYLAERPYTFFFMGRVFREAHRNGYRTRRAAFNNISHHRGPNVFVSTIQPPNYQVKECLASDGDAIDAATRGELEGCVLSHSDALYAKLAAKAKFHLMIRGDDWTSQRLYDAIHSGSLVIVLSDGLWDKGLPFGCLVDWDSLVIRIPEEEFRENPIAAMDRYVPNWETSEGRAELHRRLRVLRYSREDLIWNTPDSRVAENFLRTAVRRCLPEAHLIRRPSPNVTEPRTLQQLTCRFSDYDKGHYSPGRHGTGIFQYNWNQDD